jgi:hypothetical protein
MDIDPKRTGVKAREIPNWPNAADEQARFFGEPGDMIRTAHGDGSVYGFLVACPGCGQFGSLPVHASAPVRWSVTGSLDDVTTLSLEPSILKHCCSWHGWLRKGVFESC